MIQPKITPHEEMLREWGETAVRFLASMIKDIWLGRLMDDTLTKDMEDLSKLMGRREVLVKENEKRRGTHCGPGTPGYRPIDYTTDAPATAPAGNGSGATAIDGGDG